MTSTITVTPGEHYTEAKHVVHATITGAPWFESFQTGGAALLQPTGITVNYDWFGQRGETWWSIGNIETGGRWVTEDGQPDPRFAISPSATVIHSLDDAPEWAAAIARRHFPHDLHLIIPGQDSTSTTVDGPTNLPEGIVLADTHQNTVVRHVLHSCPITGATPQAMPRDYGPARWARPEKLTVIYHLLGDKWATMRFDVTGPYVTEQGELDERNPGTAMIHFRRPPEWLTDFVKARIPTDHELTRVAGDNRS